MNLKQTSLLFIAFSMNYCFCQAQCTIPNGGFDNWSFGGTAATGKTYDLPNEWNESIIPNVFSRFFNGAGFFYEYDSSDANGSALSLYRGVPLISVAPINSGLIRFECDDIPGNTAVKLTGRYKFSGSDIDTIVDTLIIASYFSNVSDTLTLLDLHQRVLPTRAKQLIVTDESENFIDFEIDLSEFAGQDVDYATIQLIMKSGSSNPLAPGYSNAVIDDLELVYEPIIVGMDEATLAAILIYPNPIKDWINIELNKPSSDVNILIFNSLGQVILNQNYATIERSSIDFSNYPNGVYVIKILTANKVLKHVKVIKN